MNKRVATLGAGFFSQFHRGSWQRLPDIDLVGVVDHDIARARDTGFPAYATLDDLLATETLDILDIDYPSGFGGRYQAHHLPKAVLHFA